MGVGCPSYHRRGDEIKENGENMKTYGVDYLDPSDDSIKYLVVDANSLDEAREKARKILISYEIPKRNIINLEHLDWLDK
jgi:hypothetical protein